MLTMLGLVEPETCFDFMRGFFAPAEDFGGEDASGDEEDNDDGQRPSFAWQGIRDVDDVLGQDAEKEDVEDAQEIDGIESGGDGQGDADPVMVL